MGDRTYKVNEVFYSVQGEGMRAGEASVFVRFSHCNMECAVESGPKSPGGFDCDTEFESGRRLTLRQLATAIWEALAAGGACLDLNYADETAEHTWGQEVPMWIVLTGGEPALQVDAELCAYLRDAGFKLAIETNGSILLATESEKLPQAVTKASHIESYIDSQGPLGIPPKHFFPFDWITVSPKVAEHAIRQRWAHEVKYVRGHGQALPETVVEAEYALISPAFDGLVVQERTMRWCQQLVMENPSWRLSIQTHKMGGGIR